MITLTWTSALGETFAIAPPSVWLRPGREGFANVATRRHTARTPYGHGAIPLATLYEPRELMIPVTLKADDEAGLDTLERALVHAFAPGGGLGTLRYVREDLRTMTIRAEATETPDVLENEADRGRGHWQNVDIRLVADDPFWYSDEETAALGSFAGEFAFPFSFPIVFGATGPSITVVNDGDLEAPVEIEIAGPCTNPTVTNHTTGAWFGVDTTVAANEVLVITAERLNKTIYRINQTTGARTSLLQLLRTGSTWIEVVPGNNLFGVSTNGAGIPIAATVRWLNRYAGA